MLLRYGSELGSSFLSQITGQAISRLRLPGTLVEGNKTIPFLDGPAMSEGNPTTIIATTANAMCGSGNPVTWGKRANPSRIPTPAALGDRGCNAHVRPVYYDCPRMVRKRRAIRAISARAWSQSRRARLHAA